MLVLGRYWELSVQMNVPPTATMHFPAIQLLFIGHSAARIKISNHELYTPGQPAAPGLVGGITCVEDFNRKCVKLFNFCTNFIKFQIEPVPQSTFLRVWIKTRMNPRGRLRLRRRSNLVSKRIVQMDILTQYHFFRRSFPRFCVANSMLAVPKSAQKKI